LAYLHCPEIVHGTFSPDEVIDSKSERKIVSKIAKLTTGKYDFKVRTVQLLGVEDAEVELSDLTVEMEELIVELEALPAALLAEMRLTVVLWAVKFLAVVGLSAEKALVVAMGQFSLPHVRIFRILFRFQTKSRNFFKKYFVAVRRLMTRTYLPCILP